MTRFALDANLLLLLIIGAADPAFIEKHMRLRNYGRADFEILRRALNDATEIVITPNVATEVSNIAAFGVREPLKTRIAIAMGAMFSSFAERYVRSEVAAEQPEFSRLGLTDCAALCVLDGNIALLTDDMDLYLAASNRGLEAYNFSRLRAPAA